MSTLVRDQITPVKPEELIEAFERCYFREFDGPPLSTAAVALFVAQSALETGRWKSIHCYNIGNFKAGKSWDGLYCQYRCNEIINGKEEWFDPPHPQTWFRAYEYLDDAVIDYLITMSTRKNFKPAFDIAKTGDAAKFVRALAAGHYFTANAAAYERAVVSLQSTYLNLCHGGFFEAPDFYGNDTEWDRLKSLVRAQQLDIE